MFLLELAKPSFFPHGMLTVPESIVIINSDSAPPSLLSLSHRFVCIIFLISFFALINVSREALSSLPGGVV